MRRVLIRIVLLLIIGVVINIAIAWGLAVRPENKPGPIPQINIVRKNIGTFYWTTQDGFYRSLQFFEGETRVAEENGYFWGYGKTALTTEEFNELLPIWSQLAHGFPTTDVENATRYEETASGWPLLSMCYQRWQIGQRDWSQMGVLEIPKSWIHDTSKFDSLQRRRELPLIPIWPGFYINTLLYACVAWLVFFAPFTALRFTKRARRRRNGWCLQCGYDLRGATNVTCPECGHAPATADVYPRL